MEGIEPVATATDLHCQHCGGPMKPASRRNLQKRFCSDRCRVADRDDRIRAAIAEIRAAVEETQGELERLTARLNGAMQLLEQITPKPRRPRPAKQPAAPSPELVTALEFATRHTDAALERQLDQARVDPYPAEDGVFVLTDLGQAVADQIAKDRPDLVAEALDAEALDAIVNLPAGHPQRREAVAQALEHRLGVPAVGGPDCLCMIAGRVNPYCPVHGST